MKNRTDAYNSIYLPYIEKHLGDKVLQNILVTGAHGGGMGNEVQRHKNLNYEYMFHYELNPDTFLEYLDLDNNQLKHSVIQDNIFSPKEPIESVNLIFFDGQWFTENGEDWTPRNLVKDITSGILKVLDSGFKNNKLGIIVVVYADDVGFDWWQKDSIGTYDGVDLPFNLLKQKYGNYKTRDYFHEPFSFEDDIPVGHTTGTSLSGVVFYE